MMADSNCDDTCTSQLALPAQPQSQQHTPSSPPLRRGKWTPEEETYALAAIHDFNSGYLDASPGTTLRSYLSHKLKCDPMRITKKFTGDASIGKKVFHPGARDDPTILQDIEDSQAKLEHLYQQWKQREQAMARKSMATAAASGTTSLCDNSHLSFLSASSPSNAHGVGSTRVPQLTNMSTLDRANILGANTKCDITKTASWLDQADSLLSKNIEGGSREIEEEMKKIKLLIDGAPEILSISAELPKLLGCEHGIEFGSRPQASMHRLPSCPDLRILCAMDKDVAKPEQAVSTPTVGKRKLSMSDDGIITDSPINPMKILASLSSQAVPAPMPVPIDVTSGGEFIPASANSTVDSAKADPEDAKTFVNFLQSVVNE